MNQILYTGGKKGKSGNISDAKKIIIFFAIFIAIFGICLIVAGSNLLSKVKKPAEDNTLSQNTTNTIPSTPVIESNIKIAFSSVEDGVKINITSKLQIKTIEYWWDNEETMLLDIENVNEHETVIKTKQGTHTLYINVTDINDYSKKEEQLVIGDTEPELTIGTDGISNYVVKAKDDEQLTKMIIKINDEIIEEIEINTKEHEKAVPIPVGSSIIDVTVYNLNGLSVNKKARITSFGQ